MGSYITADANSLTVCSKSTISTRSTSRFVGSYQWRSGYHKRSSFFTIGFNWIQTVLFPKNLLKDVTIDRKLDLLAFKSKQSVLYCRYRVLHMKSENFK